MKPINPTFQLYVEHVGGRAIAASRLGITPGMVGHIIKGRRGVSPTVARAIESDTDGLISRAKLRPDLWGDEPVAA